MSLLELTPELREVCERVWRGRQELYRNAIIVDSMDGLTIVVGEGIWDDIMANPNGAGVFERDYEILNDNPIRFGVRAWGIPIVPGGKDFMPREMRFRQEIHL